ncbi:hypothetical protein AB1N83_013757 [Pleurotus pulmonarius]
MDCHDAQELIGKEIAAHESAVRDLRAPRNTHAGISRLPIEVLSDIFLLAKLPYGKIYQETRENRGWLNVAGVCRSWRDIALSAPSMWDTLDTSKLNTLDWAATVIARSKNVPLYVSCTYPHPQTDRAVLDFVLSHMPRIRGLEVYMNDSTDVRIQDIIDMGSTQCALQTLTLDNRDYRYNADNGGVDRFLAEVQMPHLRTLAVRSFTLPSIIPMLPQLRHLYYTSSLMSNSNSNTTVSQMLSFLRSTPSLERLEIVGSFGTSDNGSKECTTVELTKLLSLSYKAARFEHASLLRFLHYPPTSRVKFVSRSSPSDTTTCATELASIFTRMESSDMAATIETVSLATTDGVYFEMRMSSHDGLMLEIEFPVVGGEMLPLFRLPVMLPCSGAHTLHIREFCSAQVADWASFFTRHGQIQVLTATEVDSNFFRALLKPSESEPPPFMCLEHLFLRFCDIRDSDNAALVEQILKEHRNLEAHVEVTLEIWDCRVTEDSITRFKAYANVEWDGDQRFVGDSEEEDEDDSDEDFESDGDDNED